MKHIEKKIQNEPATLKKYRETTPNATYSGFVDAGQFLKKALLSEQGHICAYCNRRISTKLNDELKSRIEVEHFLSQEKYPEQDLNYLNMFGVCNGITAEKNEHCDKSKKSDLLKKIDPRKPEIDSLLDYSLSGKIMAVANSKDVKSDIELLNLNDAFLEKIEKTNNG